jgi:hypothetical protein
MSIVLGLVVLGNVTVSQAIARLCKNGGYYLREQLRRLEMQSKESIMRQFMKGIQNGVEGIRESSFAKGVDAVLDGADKVMGVSGKAWMANGLEELRQAVQPGNEQIQGGNQPGLFGTITTGEATNAREKEKDVEKERD